MSGARPKVDPLDPNTRKSLNVLADATAEVVGRNDVYEAIVKVAEEGEDTDYEAARDKFDGMDAGDRARIRSQALDSLEDETAEPEPAEPEQLDWAKQMMGNFPKLSEGLDGDK